MPRAREGVHSYSFRSRDALAVFALALGLRLFFSLLMANTYDQDEFVYLALARDVAHGAIPYRDFAFFHPPGILVLLAPLSPLAALWWPSVRLLDVLIDSATAVLVWRAGAELYGRRAALAAGVFYAVSLPVLVSAVRVDQEVIMTALGMAGVVLLLTRRSHGAAVLAGACLGAACWVKYPMLAFLPVYMLLAPRRAFSCLVGSLAAIGLLFAPYAGELPRLYRDTVTWQMFHRGHTALDLRLETVGFYWLLLNPLAVAALVRSRKLTWLATGFATGALFLFTSSSYSHYFVPLVPYAALLGAPLAARWIRLPARMVVLGCLALTLAWAVGINALAGEPRFATTRFSDIRSVVALIDRSKPGTAVLGDRLEYAYLAGRPWVAHYFWDDHSLMSTRYLERQLAGRNMVVLYPRSDPAAYPHGFTAYLNAHRARVQLEGAVVWLPTGERLSGRPLSMRESPDADGTGKNREPDAWRPYRAGHRESG